MKNTPLTEEQRATADKMKAATTDIHDLLANKHGYDTADQFSLMLSICVALCVNGKPPVDRRTFIKLCRTTWDNIVKGRSE